VAAAGCEGFDDPFETYGRQPCWPFAHRLLPAHAAILFAPERTQVTVTRHLIGVEAQGLAWKSAFDGATPKFGEEWIVARSKWANQIGRFSLWLAVASLLIAATGLTLARYDLIAKMPGFLSLLAGAVVALAGAVAALAALLLAWRQPAASRRAAYAALLLSLPFVLFIASRPLVARDVPPIHDVTTDLAAPPQFQSLPLRHDNLAGIGSIAAWRRLHAASYADIQPVTIPRPAADVLSDARELATARGWDIARYDVTGGALEATASTSYIRFKDDVVVRVRPNADGTQSIVDMRSVSRVGISDFGVNAQRIRGFLGDLAAR
jgi:hypothetical protein